jgi:hypothetical protein
MAEAMLFYGCPLRLKVHVPGNLQSCTRGAKMKVESNVKKEIRLRFFAPARSIQ